MKAEELIALATAHGIDLVEAARLSQQERPRRDTVQQRFEGGRRATVLRPPSPMLAKGRATPTASRPEWSLAELGQASKGVPLVAFRAACYAFAGDQSVYWQLWDALHEHALTLRRRRNWPTHIRRLDGRQHYYLADLARLVLDEDANPHAFAKGDKGELYAVYVGVAPHIWSRQLFERFDQLKIQYLSWLDTAHGIIAPRLRTSSEDIDEPELDVQCAAQ